MAGIIERRVAMRNKPPVNTPDEISQRIAELHKIAVPIGKKYINWVPRSDYSLGYWAVYEASGFKTLPYAGGMVDQPNWIRADFYGFMELTEYNEMANEVKRLERRLLEGATK